MKLERAQEHLTTAIAIGVGMFLAFYFGKLSGTGRFGTLFLSFLVFAFVGLLLALRENIWLLIPATWEFAGRVIEIKGNPAVKDLAVLAVFGGVFALRAFKVIRRKPTYQAIDFWVIAVLLYLFTVFLRNPTGGEVFGSERVGGRPYLNIFTAWLGFLVLARVFLPARFAKRAFWAMSSLLCFNNSLTILAINFPVTQPFLERVIGTVGDDFNDSTLPDDLSMRKGYLLGFGASIVRTLTAYFPPLSLVNPLNFIRMGFLILGVVCALLSGFRSGVVNLVAIFLVATYLRGGKTTVLRLVGAGVAGLLFLVAIQGTLVNLPFPVQRALSFLPGAWDVEAVADARVSSDWRFYMWKQMLTTDRYISSKWLGDGFGLTAMQLQQISTSFAQEDFEQVRENFMIVGQVHSGPVTAIKYVGYVGLALFVGLLATLSIESFKLCRRSLNTPFQPFAFLVGLPLVVYPFQFIFVFGSYDNDVPTVLLGAGMLKMLRISLDMYDSSKPAESLPGRSYESLPAPAAPAVPAHLRY